ncbi:MAG TPA: diguanylate cyclase [Pirellulaceae bacterium]|nr:diguanylate cyclase [Pirellulaceae bacterium]
MTGPSSNSNTKAQITAENQHSCRLLVVDDESINREILYRMLIKSGYQAQMAESAQAALDLLARESFDLVLLDLMMPEIDGMECLRRIRQRYPIDQLAVIMITADADRQQVVNAFRNGANDYVTKPVDREVTLARIATHTQLRRATQALRESEERYALAAQGANDGLWDWNVRTGSVYYSPRFTELLGYESQQWTDSGHEWLSRIHVDERDAFAQITGGEHNTPDTHFDINMRMVHRDGSYRWMLCRGIYLRDAAGNLVRMAGSLTDITKGKVADPLTGLPNRLLFMDRLQCAWQRYQRNAKSKFAVVFLDLDNFKSINDNLGHQVGDQMLITIARRIEESLRRVDSVSRGAGDPTAARLAGDEFTVLLEDVDSTEDVAIVVKRLLREIAQPIVTEGGAIIPTVSMGWAIIDDSVTSAEDILGRADKAMYSAKSEGKNRSLQYAPAVSPLFETPGIQSC